MKLVDLENKKVALWGFGMEGKASLAYLQKRLPDLSLTILCPQSEAGLSGVKFNHDEITADLLSRFDVVVKSPGISPYQDCVENSTAQFTSATALWFANERRATGAQIIAVTGTKGKSTTAAMLTHVLTGMGFNAVLAGNFGVPLLEQTTLCDYVVLETSSYQAYDGEITADVGLLLNLYSEHLDWHGSESQYHKDKCRVIASAQQVVLNAKDEKTLKSQIATHHNQVSYFASEQSFYVLNNSLMYQDKALFSLHAWSLKGRHNLLNAAAVCQVVSVLGLNIMACINHIKTFKSLPHRLQLVGLFNGVIAVNDSISSTPQSTMAALDTVKWDKTILLVGGFDRGLDWQCFVDFLVQQTESLKQVVCSGQNGEKIYKLVQQAIPQQQVALELSLDKAVEVACKRAEVGDTILLSPGAPSFDAFANYQQRGVQFEAWIKQYFMC
ncbi:UDP-N-acetylmuramoyl-L-alanine--D-glutamate ligase [Marinicella rhabdoformis]|uniref:UDP-N-acetylmuramoyl-L-alanine--D-glutamate ligase n=1 Tax=Marinicella rhabdoformis TaxID=2580566 RepID=UPI0012AED0C2|nr:UDP-N-acetylmuramoyl-L-alanine--D-glutamate ligase [Marinicella rhabdoformis]